MAISLSSEPVPAIEAAQSAAPARPVAKVVQARAPQKAGRTSSAACNSQSGGKRTSSFRGVMQTARSITSLQMPNRAANCNNFPRRQFATSAKVSPIWLKNYNKRIRIISKSRAKGQTRWLSTRPAEPR